MRKVYAILLIILIASIVLYNFPFSSSETNEPQLNLNKEIMNTTSIGELKTTLTKLGYDVWDKEKLFIASEKNSSKPPLVNHTRDSDLVVYDVYDMDAFTTALKILEVDYDISLTKKDMKYILSKYANKDKVLSYKNITFQFFESIIGKNPYSTGIQFHLD